MRNDTRCDHLLEGPRWKANTPCFGFPSNSMLANPNPNLGLQVGIGAHCLYAPRVRRLLLCQELPTTGPLGGTMHAIRRNGVSDAICVKALSYSAHYVSNGTNCCIFQHWCCFVVPPCFLCCCSTVSTSFTTRCYELWPFVWLVGCFCLAAISNGPAHVWYH